MKRPAKALRKGGRAPTRAERIAAGMVPVEVWLSSEHAAALDDIRGDEARGACIRGLVVAEVARRERRR